MDLELQSFVCSRVRRFCGTTNGRNSADSHVDLNSGQSEEHN